MEIPDGKTVVVCDYCGIKQTLPRLDSDRKANLYERANHFRRNNDYDKAEGIYEQILNEDSKDAEAYWSLVLCRYGIEYVEDPATKKRVPTVNRAQFTSIFSDEDYKSALLHADLLQREVYEAEAKAIDEIQKGILAISEKEKPFDVFICYKETDANGRRTQDSVLANDLYHQLTQEGFKVFFAKITLEDKLGIAYEPYIFAALHSSKVMVVLGTRPEHFNAVWVKNEWSRYLALIKKGEKKVLIPAYRDMDPYDLPEEFSHLQAQDMSKLGFMQDLLRGIKKIIGREEAPKVRFEAPSHDKESDLSTLLKRVHIFLEGQDWESADIYCEKMLDIDPENADAYVCKLLAQLKLPSLNRLSSCTTLPEQCPAYQNAVRFADPDTTELLVACNRRIKEKLSQEKQRRNEREALIASLNAAKIDKEAMCDRKNQLTMQLQSKERAAGAAQDVQKKAKSLLTFSIIHLVCLFLLFPFGGAIGAYSNDSLDDLFGIILLIWIAVTVCCLVLSRRLKAAQVKAGMMTPQNDAWKVGATIIFIVVLVFCYGFFGLNQARKVIKRNSEALALNTPEQLNRIRAQIQDINTGLIEMDRVIFDTEQRLLAYR